MSKLLPRLLFLTTACLTGTALAAPPPPPAAPPPAGDDAGGGGGGGGGRHKAGRGACKADAARLCPELKGKKRTACLVEHAKDLSPECKEDVDRKQAKVQMRNDCKADADKFCADVPPGKDNLESCLVGRKAELAPACQAVMEKVIADFKTRPARKGGHKGHKGE